MENRLDFKAWDTKENVMLTQNIFSSFGGCDSSDGKENRSDRKSLMTWNGACYHDGELLHLIMLQYIGLKAGPSQPAKIYESDILKYNNKLWKVEYCEHNAGYILTRNLFDFGEDASIKLTSDIAFESDHFGNFYLNSDVVGVEKARFLEENPE